MASRLASVFILLVASFAAVASPFDEALELQRKGRPKEARELLRSAASTFRASADQRNLAKALSLASQASIALGDYGAAIQDANAAVAVRRKLKDEVGIGEDLNSLGRANLYLGNYGLALSSYQQALELARAHGSAEGEIVRLNNIGNVYYFQGRYSDALRVYQSAMDKVNATSTEKWNPERRQLTLANLATLYQRLGKEQTALALYRQLANSPQAMPPSQQAQLLLNEGVLYRRMGDPVKALDRYRASQTLFATERHQDGEIGALRNIGIARAVDLNDLPGALDAFTAAWRLAQSTSDVRGSAQAGLYRAEVLRRLHRLPEAETDARAAAQAAQKAGLVEEQWKAEYTLGKIAEDRGQSELALGSYQKAMASVESVRARLRQTSLRSEFLADKRDVYDSLISLRLRQPATAVGELFGWVERSRARTLVERLASPPPTREPALEEIQSRLGPDTVLLDYWVGSDRSATLWITASDAGVVRHTSSFGWIQDAATRLAAAIQDRSENWNDLARVLGSELLADVPLRRHVLVVPDGPLGTVPFEILSPPGSEALLIERSDVTYLPSTAFVLRGNPSPYERWLPPWHRQLVAFGDPPVSGADIFAGAEQWQRLAASADEVEGIAHLSRGRSETYLGADARKRHLLEGGVAGVPLLHFSTHAIVDEENPDRSRILLAPDSSAAAFDYLFEGEVYNLDLHGVDLTTVSACDTARGKLIRGEGVEAFSRAFLAAGSSATITSLWRAPDRPTADFMKQLYYFLAQGQSKAEALRSAKLQFLRSHSTLASPLYWATFVLNGDGWNACRRVIPWSACIGAAAVCFALAGLIFRWRTGFHKGVTAGPARQ